LISRDFISALKVAAGDYIGGFTSSGKCAGIIQVSNLDENHCLTLFADCPLTVEMDGFYEEEPISLRHFKVKDQNETGIEAHFDPTFPNQGFFSAHGISALKAGELSIGSFESVSELNFNIFPNPARAEIAITWNSEKPEKMVLLIYNAFGQLVNETKIAPSITAKQQLLLDVSSLEHGTYSVILKTSFRSEVKKLILII